MGNHAAGYAVGQAAELALSRRQPGETALALLDRACKGHHNTDAEFESTDPDEPHQVHPDYSQVTDPHPMAALGMLMVEAFAPNGLADLPRYTAMLGYDPEAPDVDAAEAASDAAYGLWDVEVNEPFRARYGFC